MSNWMTMETAPKDGTIVDLWVRGERLANCFWWQGGEEGEPGWQQKYAEASQSFAVFGEPTNWMPLPAPPGAKPEVF